MRENLSREFKLLIDIHAAEDLHTEFKRSAIVRDRKANELTKEICAFGNSDGGRILIGIIEGKNGAAEAIDEGVPPEIRGKEWIDQIIESQIRPRILTVDVIESFHGVNYLYQINVKRSVAAPHQNQDRRYYKRSGSQSLPMEDYEIQDIRSRSLVPGSPVSIEILVRGFLFILRISNISQTDVHNFNIHLTSNFQDLLRQRGLDEKRLTTLKRASTAEYVIGSSPEIFEGNGKKPDLSISGDFVFLSEKYIIEERFPLSDYEGQLIVRSQEEEYLRKISDGLDKIERNQRDLLRFMEQLKWPVDGTGLHISSRTIDILKGAAEPKYDPSAMDISGFVYLLDISRDDARKIWRAFQYIGRGEALQEVAKLGDAVLTRFYTKFFIDE